MTMYGGAVKFFDHLAQQSYFRFVPNSWNEYLIQTATTQQTLQAHNTFKAPQMSRCKDPGRSGNGETMHKNK